MELKNLTIAGAVLLLSACGGSSSDDNPSSTPNNQATITAENSVEISAAVAGTALDSEVPNATEFLPGNIGSAKPNLSFAKASIRNLNSFSQVAIANQGDLQINCQGEPAGTITYDITLANENTLTAGDEFSTTFDNCTLGDILFNGSVIMRVTAFSGDLFMQDSFSMGFEVEFDNYNVSEENEIFSINGDISTSVSFENSVLESSFSSNSLTIVAEGETHSLSNYEYSVSFNESTQAYSLATSGSFSNSEIGGTVSFETIEAFTGTGDDNPSSGQMLITGADGASVMLTAQNSVDVLLEIDLDGDEVIDETIQTTWDALEDEFEDD